MKEHKERSVNDFGLGLLDVFDFSDMLLNIEIDTKEWVGKSAKSKISYLKRELLKGNGNKMLNVVTKLVGGICSLVRYNTDNKIIHDYMGLVDTGLSLIKANTVINNAFISSTVDVKTDYDAIAKIMGFTSGKDIVVSQVDVTADICKAFIEMDKDAQKKHHIEFVKVQTSEDDDDADTDDKIQIAGAASSEKMITTYILADVTAKNGYTGRVGFELGYMSTKQQATDVDGEAAFSYCNVCISAKADILLFDVFDEIDETIYGAYIDTIDISKNLIKIDNGILTKTPRVDIDFDVHNFDLADKNGNIIRTIDTEAALIKTVLDHGHRRGYIIQGEPGTGKTISINKLLMRFTDRPVFWITASSVSEPGKMHDVFRILNMFPGSIFVFDDFDGNDFSKKNPLTTTFISCIDETTSRTFSGILFLIINEPQSLHNTIKFRSGRIDDIIYVKNPETAEQVEDIVTQRFNHMHIDKPDWISASNPEFVEAANVIIAGHLTHAHICGIIRDMVELHDTYDCKLLNELIERRMTSIKNGKLVAYDDGHIGEETEEYRMQSKRTGSA